MTVKKVTVSERLVEIRKAGVQYRAAEVVAVNREARTVELAFSSNADSLSRWYGIEVLSHDPAHVRLDRLNNGGAVLWNHDWDDQRGVINDGTAKIDGDGKGRCVIRLSRNKDGEELLTDMEDGIKRHVSVGYMVHGIKLLEERDGVDVYLVDDWEPYEISIVSVPFDTSVGVGRSAEIPQEEVTPAAAETAAIRNTTVDTRKPEPMKEKTLRNAAGDLVRAKVDDDGTIVETIEVIERAGDASKAHADRGAAGERTRVSEIGKLSERFGKGVPNMPELERKAIADGISPAEF